jgi:hypothetical protein
MTPTGGPCLSVRERRERREAHGWASGCGRKYGAGWDGPRGGKGRKGERPAGLGCAEEKEKEEKEDGLGQEEKKSERKRKAFKSI